MDEWPDLPKVTCLLKTLILHCQSVLSHQHTEQDEWDRKSAYSEEKLRFIQGAPTTHAAWKEVSTCQSFPGPEWGFRGEPEWSTGSLSIGSAVQMAALDLWIPSLISCFFDLKFRTLTCILKDYVEWNEITRHNAQDRAWHIVDTKSMVTVIIITSNLLHVLQIRDSPAGESLRSTEDQAGAFLAFLFYPRCCWWVPNFQNWPAAMGGDRWGPRATTGTSLYPWEGGDESGLTKWDMLKNEVVKQQQHLCHHFCTTRSTGFINCCCQSGLCLGIN